MKNFLIAAGIVIATGIGFLGWYFPMTLSVGADNSKFIASDVLFLSQGRGCPPIA